jgi:hypothetical protein
VVEQRTENPRVVSSTLTLGTMNPMSGSSSVVERLLAKEKAASSNLVFRSITYIPNSVEVIGTNHPRRIFPRDTN